MLGLNQNWANTRDIHCQLNVSTASLITDQLMTQKMISNTAIIEKHIKIIYLSKHERHIESTFQSYQDEPV
jgi:hypothetical protein